MLEVDKHFKKPLIIRIISTLIAISWVWASLTLLLEEFSIFIFFFFIAVILLIIQVAGLEYIIKCDMLIVKRFFRKNVNYKLSDIEKLEIRPSFPGTPFVDIYFKKHKFHGIWFFLTSKNVQEFTETLMTTISKNGGQTLVETKLRKKVVYFGR